MYWNISASDLIYYITGVSCIRINARIVVFSRSKFTGGKSFISRSCGGKEKIWPKRKRPIIRATL